MVRSFAEKAEDVVGAGEVPLLRGWLSIIKLLAGIIKETGHGHAIFSKQKG
jgi:hypothetical protein